MAGAPAQAGPGGLMEPAGEQQSPLFRAGHVVDREVMRRGRPRLARHMPDGFDWPFRSWEEFCEALSEQYRNGRESIGHDHDGYAHRRGG